VLSLQKHCRLRRPPRRNGGRPPPPSRSFVRGVVIFYLAERTVELSSNLPNSSHMGTATKAVPPRLQMGYLQQEPLWPEGLKDLLNMDGLPMAHRFPLNHRRANQALQL